MDKENNRGLYCSITNNYIEALWQQEKYDTARKVAYRNLDDCVKYLGSDDPVTGKAYLNLAILSFLTGYSGITDAYFFKSLDVFTNLLGKESPETANVLEWLGIYHNSISDTSLAREYLWEALKIRAQIGQAEDYRSGNLYRYMGLFYKRFGKLDSALYCFNKAKQLFDTKFSTYNFKSVKCLNNISDIYEIHGLFDTALAIHKQSLELIKAGKIKNRYSLMMTYFNISELYRNFGDPENALKYMQKVLKLYYPGLKEDCITCNPSSAGKYPYAIIKTVLAYKARYLKAIYDRDRISNSGYLISSAQCYELVNKITEALRDRITNVEELVFFEHVNNNMYMEMADNALLVYEITHDTAYLSTALNYLSINRNTNKVLADEVLAKEYLANVPDNFMKTKKLFRKELNELLSRRSGVDKTDADKKINILIADKKIEMDILEYKLTQSNPGAIKSFCKNENIYLRALTNKLKEDQALVWLNEYCPDYIETPDSVLIIALSGNGFKYFKVDGNKTLKLINDYQEIISGDIYRVNKIDSIGYLLYSLLFAPLENIISNKELIIIPSQHISMIPFDALPVEPAPNPKRMIDRHTIWNEFSALLFLQADAKPGNITNKVLAVAPQFNRQQKEAIAFLTKRDTALINLPGAKTECERIGALFDTKILYGQNASLGEFKANCPDYQIIHLSTHAIPDKGGEEAVRLVFSDYRKINDEGSLDLYEVLNLPLNADLVVLSACKTGVGKMSKGEGNINMAWAFNKAGAKSVLVSLWDANDFASSVIMPDFYKYLAEGMTKPHALRQAKLDFINSADELSISPYFWAGFEYWGNDEPIRNMDNAAGWKLIMVLLFVLLSISGFVYFRVC
ncbi:MAG: CHAT domain-containing protein [Chlorobi bacterium]|nr:CHAT domain-containing protein [Chlorobiota bacterium]